MFRKSALAMAMLGALAAQNAVALGLGEIELKSALNQPLLAEVELVSATPAELNELKVEIASSQAFADAGIERPLFLTKLNFNLDKNAAGRPVVKITSRDVVREPFLDFLLELSWSRGKLLREYTVLIDPPVTMPAPAPVLQAPVVQAAQPYRTAPSVSATAGRVQHTAQMPPVRVLPNEYLTQRNDTLWKVAETVRPDDGVSMEQAMLGLLRSNPDAFYNNNINNLKAGYVLRVPGRDEMTSISQAQALREARAQYQAWRQAQQGGAAAETTASADNAAPGEPGASSAGAQLQLVAPDLSEPGAAGGGAGATDDLATMKRDLMMANEALEAQRLQGEEMSGRLAVLEEQIRNMQRLVQLKDDQLAQLQAQVSDSGEAPVVAETMAEGVDAAAASDTADATSVAESAEVMESAVDTTGQDVAEPVTDAEVPAETVPTPAAEIETPAEAVVAPPTEVVPEELVGAAARPDTGTPDAPDTATSPGLVEQILANPLWLGAGGVVLALLAFVGLRRKRAADTGFEESILQASQGARSKDEDSVVTATRGSSESGETSLLSEFAVSDMGSLKSGGEADPLAEADVYLAYGRFQQAEDLVSEALENAPDDEHLNLKLLEVFLAAKNRTSFDAHAQGMLGRLTKVGEPLWDKVSEMGRELSPDNALYSGGSVAADEGPAFDQDALDAEGAAAADARSAAMQDDDSGLDFDIDLSYKSEEPTEENKPDSVEFTAPEPAADLEFDMDSVEPDALEQDNALDFDLEGLDLTGVDDTEAEASDGELTDLDEVSTKLDLARAYIDMGDPDGARSILDEVLEEGSDEQVNEAKGIMEQIS